MSYRQPPENSKKRCEPTAVLPVPLERMEVAPTLDGSLGMYRGDKRFKMIEADTDVDAIKEWLTRVKDSTFRSYRREADRLLSWSVIDRAKPLSSLTNEDLAAYEAFLVNPQPGSRWIMKSATGGKRIYPRSDENWRPFLGPLSENSKLQAIIILRSMFTWLRRVGYLAVNPYELSESQRRRFTGQAMCFLEENLWLEVKHTIKSLKGETKREQEHYRRVRWLFSLFYGCGLCISEVTNNSMGALFSEYDIKGNEMWWLQIAGKGGQITKRFSHPRAPG